jgi:hypothetical protein
MGIHPDGDEPEKALMDALTHPLQSMILIALREGGPKSAQEISVQLGESPRRIRYQLQQMSASGLVSLVEKKTRRGVAEKYFAATGPSVIDDNTYARIPSANKLKAAVTFLKAVFADTSHAVRSASIGRRVDHLSRVRFAVDERGWCELLEVHRRAFEEVERVRAEAALRLNGDQDPVWVASVQMCFESPPRDEQRAPASG